MKSNGTRNSLAKSAWKPTLETASVAAVGRLAPAQTIRNGQERSGRKMSKPANAITPLSAIIGTECRPRKRTAAASQLETKKAPMRRMLKLQTEYL
ncbi:hypothetical protein [Paraburkholderia sp.]|uniref:hypothetical protein n=1 Tax=Paraburkholderia sp. TaxID=1926495 RepID=UPI0025CF5E1E|nr:hypothetical protein [Paraburkholderia sp.]